jgi:hypothetical protein
MPVAHEGDIQRTNSFRVAHAWLLRSGPVELRTTGNCVFTAEAAVCSSGAHAGESVIRFFQLRDHKPQEFGRCYPCCWEHYYNCNRTRIGMYVQPLDAAIE